jgi:putative ABC transport system permease protein
LLYEEPGLAFEHAAVLAASPSTHGVDGPAGRLYWTDVKQVVAANPETAAAALASQSPLDGGLRTSVLADAPDTTIAVLNVDPEFFQVMMIPILAGRSFHPGDDFDATIVSRRLALRMYATLDVIGKGFPRTRPQRTIVGIAGDAPLMHNHASNTAEQYLPLGAAPLRRLALIARARSDPARLLAPMKAAAAAVDGRVAVQAKLMRSDVEGKTRVYRLAGLIAASAAVFGLLLSCLGIFGLVAYNAGLRRREIGIRMAMGAGPREIIQFLLYRLVSPVCCGAMLGIAIAVPLRRALQAAPFFLAPAPLADHAGVISGLLVATAAAALFPALKAARSDPFRWLRYEQ